MSVLDVPIRSSRNFRFGLSGPIQYRPNRRRLIPQAAFFPSGAVFGPGKRGGHPAHKVKNLEILHFQCIPQTPLLPSRPGHPDFAVPIASVYPVATARAPIRRTMLPNSRLVRWLSASISQYYRACFTSLPPVFTNRCCKLVSDQFSIFFGSTSRRHRFPRLYASTLNQRRTSLDRKR